MKVLTVGNEKGGVGKTLFAVHIAAGLAMRDKRVLLIDSDAQGNATRSLGIEKYPGFYDWLVRGVAPEQVITAIHPAIYGCASDVPPLTPHELASLDVDDQAVRLHQRGLDVSRLHLLGSNIESYLIASMIGDEALFAQRLAELADRYDYAIIDTGPTPTLLHTAIYRATEHILYPTLCEFLALDGLQESLLRLRGIRRVNGGRIKVAGIIPNQYRSTTIEHQENLKLLQAHFGKTVWPAMPLAIVLAETPHFGLPVWVHAPGSDATLALYEILDRVEDATNGK